MGKLLQSVIAKLQELDERRQEPAPDYKNDPHAAMEYIKRRNAEEYERRELGRKLVLALRSLPKAQRDRFYDRCVLPAARAGFTKTTFDDYLDPESESGKKEFGWILKNSKFGQDWQRAVETLEEMIGPEEVDRLSDEVDSMVAPTHSMYSREDKLVYPYGDIIADIKSKLDPFHPDSLRDSEILDEVKEELAYVNDDTRALLDRIDLSVEGVKGYQAMVNGANYDMQNRFLRQDLEGGKFKDKFPHMQSSDASDGIFYTMDDVDLNENGPLRAEDIEEIKHVKPNISPELVNDVVTATNKLEGLGENEFRNGYTSFRPQGGAEGDRLFSSEQAYKLYAYWPLYNARKKLETAVREKNMEKIRQAHEKYKETKKALDDMLGIVKKHPTGLSEGNVNSTRPIMAGEINPVPLEHLEDYAGHSQVNGLFCLYALGKNTGYSPEQLLEDPVGCMAEAGKQQVEQRGLGSCRTTGEKLYWGLSGTACDVLFQRDWSAQTAQLCGRGFNTVACLSDDPEERSRIAGTAQLAIAAGTVPVKEHCKQWKKVWNCSKEQRNLLYQHALLLPEEEFKPLEYGEAFSKPDWKEKLDTNALIERLKREGKFDYGKLADRVNEIIAETAPCDRQTDTAYSSDGLIETSRNLFKELIKKATPEERETEGFKKLEAYTGKMLLDTTSFQRGQRQLEEFMDVQKEEKTGLFLSSTNSEEQKRMVRAQNTFRFKILQLQGKELPEGVTEENKEYLKTISLKEAYDVAREATFAYCNKKTDNGKSRFFVHGTGRERFDAAEDSLKIMDKMADKLELRSPARKLMDETRKEVFDKRRESGWTPEQTERAAAKLMYAMTLEHQGISPEEQAKRLTPNKLEMGIAYIRGQDAFKKMMQNEGAGKVADYLNEGGGKLTDAYVRGMNSAARSGHQEPGKDPDQMSYEEKTAVWKNQNLQM